MSDDWEVSDEEIDAWVEEWEAVDRAAAEYLAERIPDVVDVRGVGRGDWLDELAETISPSEPPTDDEVEVVSAVMALQHADWLGLAMGVVRGDPAACSKPNWCRPTSTRWRTSRERSRTVTGTWRSCRWLCCT